MDPITMAGIGLGVGNYLLSNALADKKQKRQFEQEKELMMLQNRMNNANALSAPMNQVLGLKMAGLNPSIANSQQAPVANVSKGSVGVAENVEANLDPQSLLLKAQADNLEANTEKTKQETGNVTADTELKFMQTLLASQNAEKIKQEAQNVKNINDAFASENRSIADFGKAMADKWIESDWFDKLAPDTKRTIESIADGKLKLDIGGLRALRSAIDAQSSLSDADRKIVRNAFDNAITESMFNDKSVMQAIVKEPEYRQKMLKANIDKINAEIPKIRAEMQNLLSDLETKKLSREDLQSKIDAFKRNDLGYLKSKGEYGKWLEGYAEELLMRVFPLVSGATVAKGFAGKSKAPEPSMISKPGDKDFRSTISNLNLHGVQSFHY